MEVTLHKNDLVNLVCGRFAPQRDSQFTVHTGNQWNPNWEWDRAKLQELDEEELYELYFGRKPPLGSA